MNNIENVYSLSPLQQGLLFHQNYDPGSRVYHQQVSLAVTGELDRAIFAQAWRALMERHAVLRTGFLWEDLDDAFQVVHKELALPLVEMDLRSHADTGQALVNLEREQRDAPFAFDEAPLMRLCLVRLAEREWHMIWTFHHILLDGWSVGLALRDWQDIYGALHRGERPALAPARAYHDYIGWLAEQDGAAAESYWRQKLQDVAEPTPLPLLLASRTKPEGAPCAEQELRLTPGQTQALGRFARDMQVTLNTVVQGAWALLLGGYAGRDDVLFGVTSGGRPDALNGADDMVGLFINTLPLRTGWADRPLLGDWLRRLQDANIELRQYEYTPLSRLRGYSGIASSQSLFESILVFENFPLDEALGGGAAGLTFNSHDTAAHSGAVKLTRGRNNYPLSLIVAPGQCLELTLSYDRARFDDPEIAAMAARLHELLRAMPDAALAPVTELQRASAAEKERLLALGAGPALAVPAVCLHQLFERHADLAPEQQALVSPAGAMSYAELEAAANSVAHRLLELGLVPGEIVAIALERSMDFVVAMLATLKAGGCYLPLDTKQPRARLAALLTDSGARYVFSSDRWEAPEHITALSPQPEPGDAGRPMVVGHGLDHSAYLIYTSGSTGQPKGVVVPHRAAVDYVTSVMHMLEPAPASRFALVSTTSADLGHTQLFGALCSGGTLVLVDEETAFQPAALATFMREACVDILKITPSHLRGLLAAHDSADLLPRHTLVFGGEAFDSDLLAKVSTLAPALKVFNHYGPTESTVGAVINRLDGRQFDAAIPLGRPLPNRRLYVLDDALQAVPAGVPGELYIGGGALAAGYLGAPDSTPLRFVADPFSGQGARMYRTGDRVRWLTNGELSFIGRVDSQVKIRGHRVELGEVEAHIRQLSPLITQVLARLANVPDHGPRLLAYLVAGASLSPEKLRSDLAARLPEHMLPTAFIQLDAIPLTANGKPDMRALPLPQPRRRAGRESAAPRTEMELALASIWQSVLKLERIGIDDNFFELGGDSILSLQIIARASQIGIQITPRQLFDHRTVSQLSAHLSEGGTAPSPPASARTVPLSAGQRALVEAGRTDPTWRCVALARPVSEQHIGVALTALAAHHECLRLRFEQDARGQWQQSLDGPSSVPLRHARLEPLDQSACTRLAQEATGLSAWLLDAPEGQALLLAAPALMIDDQTWTWLLEDLELALSQVAFGRAINLGQPEASFGRVAQEQTTRADADEMESSWEYWLGLTDLDLAPLPAPTVSTTAQHCVFSEEQTAQLEQLRRRTRSSWLAVAACAAQHASGRSLLPISLAAGRPGEERIAGALAYDAPFILRAPHADGLLARLHAAATQIEEGDHDYGLLRYLSSNSYLKEPLLALPKPQVRIRFSDLDNHCTPHGVLGKVRAACPQDGNPVPLDIALSLQDGRLILECQGTHSAACAAIAASLQDLAALGTGTPPAQAFPLCGAAGIDAASLPLDFDVVEDVYPLSPTQHGMLVHTLMAPGSGVYLVQQRYRWDGPLNRGALQTAWDQLLARHPILRTAIWWQGNLAPVQVVKRVLPPSFAWHDLQALDADSQQLQVTAELAAESQRGLDLEEGPLTFLRVFQLAPGRFELARSYHHMLSDGWSFGLVMDDLLHLYRAALRQEPAALAPVRPYRDYIGWLAGQDVDAARAFWEQELAGFSEPTALAVAPPPAPCANDCADVDLLLSVAQTQRLQQLCQQYQLTANTWVQGAWALLLARYSGAAEVLFGVTVAGRPADLAGAGDMVGLFINTLPLRVSIDDDETINAWLRKLMEHNLRLRQFEHTPLSDIQRWSAVPAGQALFETLVVFENAPFGAQDTLATLDARIDMLHDRSHTNYPVTVLAMPGERLGLRISYQQGRFDRSTINRMMGHLHQLLAQMLDRPHAAIGELSMLTSGERAQMDAWNSSAHDFPLERCYGDLFSEVALRHPERTAAVCAGQSLSYAELEQRSNRIARTLAARGAARDAIVAVMAERGLDLLTMMIGVLKAGAAFQPLDVNHPPRRLAELLGLSGAPILLVAGTGAALAEEVLKQTANAPLCLDAHACALQGDAAPLEQHGRPADLAYVIFTSGSTGKPKGAMVEHRGMINNIFGKVPAIGLHEGDRLAQTASPAFDISVWQFLAAPLLGATVHILPDCVAHDPARLLDAIDADGLTLLEVVPSMLRAMLDSATGTTHLSSLRWLMSIGEALPPELCRRWLHRFASVPLMNLYGPAECADNIAFHAIELAPPEHCIHMPVGRPTANNQLYVMDASMRQLPIGVAGQICTSGAGVGRGYLNDPERTTAAFLPHPFEPGARFYATGDLGRYRDDGAIEFLGRRDHQVKVQGHRIEMGEIESRMLEHHAVRAAAVITLPAADGGQRLLAFYEAVPGGACDQAQLAAHLRAVLPGYMVPPLLVPVDRMPLNANGKLDRTALALLIPPALGSDEEAPRSCSEKQLAGIWSSLLNIGPVGLHANFFALGGHSLLATQLASRVRAVFGVHLPLRTVFDHPTLSQLAAMLDQLSGQDGAQVVPPITAAPRDESLPLSFAQQRLWFVEQLSPGGGAQNLCFALRLTGRADVQALTHSLELLVSRHEVLRTAYVNVGGVPQLRINKPSAFSLPVEDCSGMPRSSIEARLQDSLHAGFDLEHGPLLRAQLLRISEDESYLGLALHHIAADGWSLAILVDELARDYAALRAGAVPTADGEPLQYADYALWQRRHMSGAVLQRQMTYWRAQLQQAPAVLTLPGYRNGPVRKAGRYRTAIAPALTGAVARFGQQHNASPFMVLHAALAVLLHQQTGSTDLIVGTDIANRHNAQTENMVGFFVNQLVLRCRLDRQQSIASLVSDCRRTALDAYEHQDVPFEALVAELLPQRTPDQPPVFQIKLVLQNTPQRDMVLDGLAVEELDLPAPETELDLLINVIPHEDRYAVVYDHACERYDAACIARFHTLFTAALELLVDEQERSVEQAARQLSGRQQAMDDDRLQTEAAALPALGAVRRKPVSI